MKQLIIFASLCSVLMGCVATKPNLDNDCSNQGVEESQVESNVLGMVALTSALARGQHWSGPSAHAENAEQQAEIIEMQVQHCEQQKKETNHPH
ncbi:hypothetical protein [Vibrio ulleungensis]|uniref:Lipoprotein n=1 Tax=Vibrio ulleungensis TaxID=2807619 RepID=A0ABS2HJ24_9VIBR|nr:hypothetical protein [Vibrio ulleungensis]MBM7036502.1 hypothetical protein [Vibrio ulleungensis]